MLRAQLSNGQDIFIWEYDKETLKKWSNKKILHCPYCKNNYQYNHGKIVSPYFKHVNSESCLSKYNEPETEEHMQGKRDLYEWIKRQDRVTDVVLEGYIEATHQRPDVMFMYNGKQYVIEYQCTPISSEYIERHELYQAAGVNDIWILGVNNYLQEYNMQIKKLLSFMEKRLNVIYYDSLIKSIITSQMIDETLDYNILWDKKTFAIDYHNNNKDSVLHYYIYNIDTICLQSLLNQHNHFKHIEDNNMEIINDLLKKYKIFYDEELYCKENAIYFDNHRIEIYKYSYSDYKKRWYYCRMFNKDGWTINKDYYESNDNNSFTRDFTDIIFKRCLDYICNKSNKNWFFKYKLSDDWFALYVKPDPFNEKYRYIIDIYDCHCLSGRIYKNYIFLSYKKALNKILDKLIILMGMYLYDGITKYTYENIVTKKGYKKRIKKAHIYFYVEEKKNYGRN